jgi:hypothetical protein
MTWDPSLLHPTGASSRTWCTTPRTLNSDSDAGVEIPILVTILVQRAENRKHFDSTAKWTCNSSALLFLAKAGFAERVKGTNGRLGGKILVGEARTPEYGKRTRQWSGSHVYMEAKNPSLTGDIFSSLNRLNTSTFELHTHHAGAAER